MSFSLDTSNVKYLQDYAAALRHHDDIKPIRNSNTRPIAERRKQHFNIRTEGVGGHLAKVVVRLYSTDIVTYTPDNRVTINMSYHSTISTRAAIRAVAGVTMDGNSPLWVQDYDHKYYPYKANMQLEVQGYRTLKIIDPIYPVVHHLNKQAMNALRKDYAPFINYLKGLIKLIGEDGFTYEMLQERAANGASLPLEVLAKGTHEQMHEAVIGLALLAHKGRFGNPLVRLKDALACFDRHLIRAHKDTVLTRSTVTDGRMVTDRYLWAMART